MHWRDYDSRLKRLYGLLLSANETSSPKKYLDDSDEIERLMEELTLELRR